MKGKTNADKPVAPSSKKAGRPQHSADNAKTKSSAKARTTGVRKRSVAKRAPVRKPSNSGDNAAPKRHTTAKASRPVRTTATTAAGTVGIDHITVTPHPDTSVAAVEAWEKATFKRERLIEDIEFRATELERQRDILFVVAVGLAVALLFIGAARWF